MQPTTQHCILCGHLSETAFCSNCSGKANEYSEVIREFVRNNPKPNIIDVYNSTGIPLPVIKGLLGDGRFELIYKNSTPQPLVYRKS